MSFNRSDAPAALVAFFKTLLGTPYSESSPPGSDADGHLWKPGEGKPNHLDCSGATKYVVDAVIGIDIDQGNAGNAVGQWVRWANLRVVSPLRPADLLFFLGGGPPPVGHTGMCVTFDTTTGTGTYISAYDTAEGLVIKPFSIHGGGYVGAVRIVNLLPLAPAPPPPPKPPIIVRVLAAIATLIKSPVTVAANRKLNTAPPIIVDHPGGGKALVWVGQKVWQGIPNMAEYDRLLSVKVKPGTVPPSWWTSSKQVPW